MSALIASGVVISAINAREEVFLSSKEFLDGLQVAGIRALWLEFH
jgi:hypothetical protein